MRIEIPAWDEKEEVKKSAFIEVEPSSDCRRFKLSKKTQETIEQAIELIKLLVDWRIESFILQGGCLSVDDEFDSLDLQELLEKEGQLKDLSDYEGYQIRLILGVIMLAGLAGINGIRAKDCISAYQEVKKYIHLVATANRHLASLGCDVLNYFTPQYPTLIWCELLLFWLPNIRGKSFDEIRCGMNQDLKMIKEKALIELAEGKKGESKIIKGGAVWDGNL